VPSTAQSAVFLTSAPGEPGRLYIVDKVGVVRVTQRGRVRPRPFVDIRSSVTAGGEQGLLSIAFDPGYRTNRLFYVAYTSRSGRNVVERLRSNGTSAILSSRKVLLSVPDPYGNHNGGQLAFGPDGKLYTTIGDGGAGGDPENRSQNMRSRFGKLLRLDVRRATPAWEIAALGLRNAWRFSFDRGTGDLWIGDVGQSNREEIDYRPFDRTEVANYGWRLREGDIETPTPEDDPVGGDEPEHYVPPVYAYERGTDDFEGFTVIGGYVYRGPDPDLQGLYFFADAGSRHVWTFDPVDIAGTRANIDGDLGPVYSQLGQPVSFGEDAKGNLYIVDYGSQTSATGQVFRIVTDSLLAGDYDADGNVDLLDYKEWKEAYGTSLALADGNKDGMVTAADYTIWRNNLGNSVHNLGAGAGGAVPEPASIVLLWQVLLLGSAAAFHRRRRGV
jgi:glucose/arabinose dehydrogenase